MIMVIDPNRCNGCEVCLDICPEGAISMNGHTAEIKDRLCIACETCVDVCPEGAIESFVLQAEKPAEAIVIHEPVRIEAAPMVEQRAAAGASSGLNKVLAELGRELLPVVFDGLFTRLAAWQENKNIEMSNPAQIVDGERCGIQKGFGNRKGTQIRLRHRRRGAGKRSENSGGPDAR